MYITRTTKSLTKSEDTPSLRQVLRTAEETELAVYVGGLTVQKIRTTRKHIDSLKEQLETLRGCWKFQNNENPDKAKAKKFMKKIEKTAEEITAELQKYEAIETIAECNENDPEGLLDDISVLLLDLIESVEVGRKLGAKQIRVLGIEIAKRAKDLTLDDVALCLHFGKCGDYGDFYRLDISVILNWLKQYRARLDELHRAEMDTLISSGKIDNNVGRSENADPAEALNKAYAALAIERANKQ